MRQYIVFPAIVLFAFSCGHLAMAGQAPNGARVFDDHCASCHANSTDARVPTTAALRQRSPESIVEALTTGLMRQQGSELNAAERSAVAEFLAGRASGSPVLPSAAAMCASPAGAFDPSRGPQWNGWSTGASNTRFQSAEQAGLSASDISKLQLKWAFGFPNATAARALPTVAGGRLFIVSQSGIVYSLDAKSGCIIWTFQ